MTKAKSRQATDALHAGGCWPTEEQVLLLRSALLEGDVAHASWRAWRSANEPETTDRGSVRLLPLVFRNLGPQAFSGPDLRKLNGAYRATWLGNQVLLKRAADALLALHAAGIPTMLLKGVALATMHYRDPGTRPMDDVDILVPPSAATRAIEALTSAGWVAGRAPAGAPHAIALIDSSNRALDLHRFAMEHGGADDRFWAASVETTVFDVPTRVLSPAHQLLHVAAHGARWNITPPVRWLADANAVQRSAGGGIDWEAFVAEAARRRLTFAIAAALEHLSQSAVFTVPEGVVEQLHRVSTTRLERWAHRASTRPPGGGNWIPVVLDQYVRASSEDRSVRLLPFLQGALGVSSRRQLATHAALKSVEVGVNQTARRIAPRLVRPCESCGRQFVSLRSEAPLCSPCASEG
jgi:hypothetical protein